MDKNTFISNKIKSLMQEGKKQNQAIAIAYSTYKSELDKMQKGGSLNLNDDSNPDYYKATMTKNKVPTTIIDGVEYEVSRLGALRDKGTLVPTEFGAVAKDSPFAKENNFNRGVVEVGQNKLDPNRDVKSLFELNRGWILDAQGNRVRKVEIPDYNTFYQEGGELPSYQVGTGNTQGNPFYGTGFEWQNNLGNPQQKATSVPQQVPTIYPSSVNPKFSPWTTYNPQQSSKQQPTNTFNGVGNLPTFQQTYGNTTPDSFNFPSSVNTTPQAQATSIQQPTSTDIQQPQIGGATQANNSGEFYQQRFQNFNPFGDQQFPSDLGYEQGTFLGKDPNYKNQLSTESLTAGQDWKKANPLPEGVMDKDLGYKSENFENVQSDSQNDYTKYNILNPYGGVSPTAGLQYGLYNLGAGNKGKAALGLGRAGLGFLREGLSAYGAGKNYKEGKEEYLDKQFNQAPKYEYYKEGGEISVAEMMTGNYLGEAQDANVEVESGEYTKNAQTGNIQEAVGEKHANGGVKTQLPDGSQVLSDFTKIGKDNAKLFSDTYGIKIKATHTFSDVMDKFKKKSGLEKLEKEEVETMEMLEKQLKTNISENTKQINLDFLGKELQEIEAKKAELQKHQDEAFKTIFEEQEKIPKKGETKEFQEGGEVPQEQEGMDIMQQVSMMLQQGVTPEVVTQQLVEAGYPEEEAIAVLQEVMQQEQAPMMQEGGRISSKYENKDLYKKQEATSENWESFGELLKNNPEQVLGEVQRLHPELYNKFFSNGKIGSEKTIAEFQLALNNKYENILKDATKLYGKDSPKVQEIAKQIEQDNFLIDDNGVRSIDSKLGNYTATRPNFQLNVIPKEELEKLRAEGINTAFQLKEKNPDIYNKYIKNKGLESDFWLGNVDSELTPTVKEPIKLPEVDLTDAQGNPINRNKLGVKNIVPMLPYFAQMTPSQMMMPKRQQVDLSRIEPNKIGVEPNLAEAERARLARSQSYAGLSPEVAAVMRSSDLATTQQANNTAISTAEIANRDAQNKADQFNASQRDREQLTNLGLDKQYEREVFATVNNQERDWRDYYNAHDAQRKADYNTIEEANLLNAMTPNYQYVPGQGVDFVNPYMFANNTEDVKNKQISAELANAKTGEEYAKIRDKYFGQMQTNTSKNK